MQQLCFKLNCRTNPFKLFQISSWTASNCASAQDLRWMSIISVRYQKTTALQPRSVPSSALPLCKSPKHLFKFPLFTINIFLSLVRSRKIPLQLHQLYLFQSLYCATLRTSLSIQFWLKPKSSNSFSTDRHISVQRGLQKGW